MDPVGIKEPVLHGTYPAGLTWPFHRTPRPNEIVWVTQTWGEAGRRNGKGSAGFW